jgi:hypothetical protein
MRLQLPTLQRPRAAAVPGHEDDRDRRRERCEQDGGGRTPPPVVRLAAPPASRLLITQCAPTVIHVVPTQMMPSLAAARMPAARFTVPACARASGS